MMKDNIFKNYNMDFSQQVIVSESEESWVPSPSFGVNRIPLEREEAESGHTTSLVEYLPGTSFSEHSHPLGEEIFVLEGTFSDEFGDYPKGTYLRNPPHSKHSPFSRTGCKLFVKLNQFDEHDTERVVLDTNHQTWQQGHGKLEVMPLHRFKTEGVALVKWPKGEQFVKHTHYGGEEILVLQGEFIDEFGHYPKLTWIRNPHLSTHTPYVEKETIIFVKTGHILKG